VKTNFTVTFKEIKTNGEPKKVPIYAPDHARATEWALVQLSKWGMKNSPFEVDELVEAPPVPAAAPKPAKAESRVKKGARAPRKKKVDPK
jgi:hypothetical protein